MKLHERFIKYCKIDTQASTTTHCTPSTKGQWDLANLLKDELIELGLSDAHVDEYCVVYATLDSNTDEKYDTVGLIAHMDTAAEFSGVNVNPRIIENYDGKDIELNESRSILVSEFPGMRRYVGHDIIVTDGNTLLGADDKAGIAEIMHLLQELKENPEIKHGRIQIAFTPDEEIGEGTKYFNVEKMNADYAFTVDGGDPNLYCTQTFNAANATLKIHGVSIHPGNAKNIMVNALNVAFEFHSNLPFHMRPEHTESMEGFNHLLNIQGEPNFAQMEYIIRNHDKQLFLKQKQLFEDNVKFINSKYGYEVITMDLVDNYYNMHEILVDSPRVIEVMLNAYKQCNINAESEAARGGTDGSRLSFMGLPCPNIGTGGINGHGPYEACSIQEMHQVVDILKAIIDCTKAN